jgi:hypothetical protein
MHRRSLALHVGHAKTAACRIALAAAAGPIYIVTMPATSAATN